MNKRATLAIWFEVAIITAMIAGCSGSGGNSPTVASINGRELKRDQLDHFLSMKLGEVGTAEASDLIRSRMFDEYIHRQLVVDAASRAGLTISDSEVDQAVQENPHLKSTTSTQAERQEIASDLLVEKYYKQVVLKDVRVSPEEIEQYISLNQSRLTDKSGFYVREIRVQSRKEAEKLRRDVMEGHHDFAAVARLHSDAPNAAQGGLARYDQGQLPEVLEKAISALQPGDVSGVVESGYGFHIFKLEKKVQPRAPDERRSRLDDRRRQLADELIEQRNQQAVDRAVETLMSSAKIKINDSALGFTYGGALRHN
ncbi:MAG TPA: peptidylprolyl isomerase [Blastocatellia bacterium]|nr:peptidylprolyl isomerase [Blastocatellia bacterium]